MCLKFLICLSLTARTWLIAHILSGLVSNSIAEILGRKKSCLIDCFAYLVGYALYGIGEDAATLCVGRAFMGFPLVTTVSKTIILKHKQKITTLNILSGLPL